MKRRAKRLAGRLLNVFTPVGLEPLDLRGAYFTSAALRSQYVSKGFPVGDARIIDWGSTSSGSVPTPARSTGHP